MLKPLLTLLCAIFLNVLTVSAQQDSIPDKIYESFDVQKLPYFPGGETALQSYLLTSIRYPDDARQKKISGTVALSFVIEKDGAITNVSPLKNPDASLTAEAIRVVEAMPKWTPGEVEGKPVRVKFLMPIRFRLN